VRTTADSTKRMKKMFRKNLLSALLILYITGISQAGILFDSGYIPHRVFNSDDKKFSDFEMMLTELAKADVVFVGEQHDDPSTHHLELAILEGLARRRGSIVVALEMFERDTQPALDDYLVGKISEAEFLKISRPWPNYAADYRPIVEIAKAKGWRVIAGNVPRKYASQVARGGLSVLEKLPKNERDFVAAEVNWPKDDYFKRFTETMSAHPGAAPEKKNEAEERQMTERFYQAQCVKDDTMAESLAKVYAGAAQPKPLIVHFNGAFHSDYRLGTAARVRQRLEKARVEVVSIVPLEQLDSIKTDDYRKRGDYVVFALRPAKPAEKK
jgi:uncharacterized iron-regulated protein